MNYEGIGSSLNVDGKVECDASIIEVEIKKTLQEKGKIPRISRRKHLGSIG